MDGPFDHDILRTTCHFVKGPNKSIMQKSILISSRQSKSAYLVAQSNQAFLTHFRFVYLIFKVKCQKICTNLVPFEFDGHFSEMFKDLFLVIVRNI